MMQQVGCNVTDRRKGFGDRTLFLSRQQRLLAGGILIGQHSIIGQADQNFLVPLRLGKMAGRRGGAVDAERAQGLSAVAR